MIMKSIIFLDLTVCSSLTFIFRDQIGNEDSRQQAEGITEMWADFYRALWCHTQNLVSPIASPFMVHGASDWNIAL